MSDGAYGVSVATLGTQFAIQANSSELLKL